MFLKIIASILLGIWLFLMFLGKGGFIHILLVTGICLAIVEIISIYRERLKD